MRPKISVEIKAGSQGENPKGIRLKNYYSEKTQITEQEIKQQLLFDSKKENF